MSVKKYRVKSGKHVFGKHKDGKQIIYKPGDIIVTDQDLLKHNAPGILKFEEVTEDLRKTREAELELLLRETKEQLKKVVNEVPSPVPSTQPTPAVNPQPATPAPAAEAAKAKKS